MNSTAAKSVYIPGPFREAFGSRFRMLVLVIAFCMGAPAPALEITEFDLDVSGLAYNVVTGKLYAAAPSTAGLQYGNRLVEIDPTLGTIQRSVFVGSEPRTVATSPDAAVGYVGLFGTSFIRRVDLASFAVTESIGLGNNPNSGPIFAEDIEVRPGSPDTIAVALTSGPHDGVAIFDSGIRRPVSTSSFNYARTITFAGLPDTLIGYNNTTTGFQLFEMRIIPEGISVTRTMAGALYGFNLIIEYAAQTIFATHGGSVNTSTLQPRGTYNARGRVIVDPALDLVSFADSGGGIRVFDRQSFQRLSAFSIPNAVQAINVTAVSSCGAGCLAIAYDDGKLRVIRGTTELLKDSFE